MHSFQAQEFSYVEYHMPTELLILSAKKKKEREENQKFQHWLRTSTRKHQRKIRFWN